MGLLLSVIILSIATIIIVLQNTVFLAFITGCFIIVNCLFKGSRRLFSIQRVLPFICIYFSLFIVQLFGYSSGTVIWSFRSIVITDSALIRAGCIVLRLMALWQLSWLVVFALPHSIWQPFIIQIRRYSKKINLPIDPLITIIYTTGMFIPVIRAQMALIIAEQGSFKDKLQRVLTSSFKKCTALSAAILNRMQ